MVPTAGKCGWRSLIATARLARRNPAAAAALQPPRPPPPPPHCCCAQLPAPSYRRCVAVRPRSPEAPNATRNVGERVVAANMTLGGRRCATPSPAVSAPWQRSAAQPLQRRCSRIMMCRFRRQCAACAGAPVARGEPERRRRSPAPPPQRRRRRCCSMKESEKAGHQPLCCRTSTDGMHASGEQRRGRGCSRKKRRANAGTAQRGAARARTSHVGVLCMSRLCGRGAGCRPGVGLARSLPTPSNSGPGRSAGWVVRATPPTCCCLRARLRRAAPTAAQQALPSEPHSHV